jgi:hypothetical protein
MGIFDFLKKAFKDTEEIKTKEEKIAFADVEELIKNKIKETKEKEIEAISIIAARVKVFTDELRENAKVASVVNIDEKEKDEKIRSVVYEGRKKYLEFLERLIDNLENIIETEQENLEKVIENINSAFMRFNENSGKSYERATIVIGKEMGNIRETMKKFSNEFIEIFKEKKNLIANKKRLMLIQLKINEEKQTTKELEKIEGEINNLSKKIAEKENESEHIKKEIEKIKNNLDYLENANKIKSVEIGTTELENEIAKLRQMIDFKSLSNFFHIFEGKMAILKLYRENFMGEFKEDKGDRLINLLNESKLNNENISNKIKRIQIKEEEIDKLKKSIKKDETEILSVEFERVKEQITSLNGEIEWKKNKMMEYENVKKEQIRVIKEELNLINFNLEY